LLLLLLFAAACSSKNTSSTVTPSNDPDAVPVSVDGMGGLKTGMTKNEVEKLVKHKISLPAIEADTTGWAMDSVKLTHKKLDCTVVFSKNTEEDDSVKVTVQEILSYSPHLRTPSGIVTGDELCKILSVYDGHNINIIPERDLSSQKFTPIKGQSDVWLFGDNTNNTIVFHMKDNKVAGMSVAKYVGEGE
ncbi:MAG: hypothetical protein JST39_12225, partial [Bacteroidetes bacterium]|nr:hypothetical protein [Bacteroidota bacterium]